MYDPSIDEQIRTFHRVAKARAERKARLAILLLRGFVVVVGVIVGVAIFLAVGLGVGALLGSL